jgi:pimeloyl-ACP methyl ester carboxylesterase
MVHGFGVESLLYAQSLARLVGLGFRVIALDVPGHGDTESVGACTSLAGYCDLIERTVERLGVQRAVFMGHSMGGRLVAEVAARAPDRAIALVLLDPIAGAAWDSLRPWLRWFPPALGLYGAAAVVDVASTLPAMVDARQAIKIGSRVRRSVWSLVTEPWNGLMAGAAVLRAAPSIDALDVVGAAGVPSVVVQGADDLLVPERAARDAATRLHATYVLVERGRHSWMVRDPEALPAIVEELLDGVLGAALERAGIVATMSLDERAAHCASVDRTPDLVEPVDVVLPTPRRSPHLRHRVL